MGPDPEGIFTAGILVGIFATLFVQWFGRRKARKAVEAATQNQDLQQDKTSHDADIKRLQERLAVMERIATDPGVKTAQQIEQLREEANREKA
ncbi:hypothetical protein SAMN02745824_2404 [Parasphingorhabdus marina DSM 22363]|uniref:Phage shock protein B n=1 Tax=Parasphingorhabdus marina DSM 22363 TaxID=1123272 RepID=A0A1N6FI99_9SPHN|nr:hypothetical protein [Parasphingorhabdus marina]SIN94936.1 hypothetical protein SAMN02745824_2404 [Parasphingorhabdus marina DSM 22363]